MTFRTLIDMSGKPVTVRDNVAGLRIAAENRANEQEILAQQTMKNLRDMTQEVDKWRNFNNWRKQAFSRFIEVAEVEHAKAVGHQKTAERLFNESVEAPRPEDRPFANTPGVAQIFREGVIQATLEKKEMKAVAGQIQEDEAKKFGIKII